MKLQYFSGCASLDDARQLYKKLAKQHHPDIGGDVEVMKAINAEYDIACARLVNQMDLSEDEKNNEYIFTQVYKEKLNKILHLEGITIELLGSWLWISGDTFKIKNILKEEGFFWAKNKQAWFWRPDTEKCRSRNNLSLDAIRFKYGSRLIFGETLIALPK